jgi:tektin-3
LTPPTYYAADSAPYQEHKRVLERAYHDTRNPQAIVEECLMQREKRRGIDAVHDDVEKSLARVSTQSTHALTTD